MANTRQAGYWALDRVRGGKVRAHLDDIERLMETGDDARQTAMLAQHLARSAAGVPFYRDWAGTTELASFPVVNKAIIRENAGQMLTDGHDPATLHVATTSGSTGTPFRIYQSAAKRQRAQAEAIYWGALAGYDLGTRMFYIKPWSGRNHMSRISRLGRNVVPVDMTRLEQDHLLHLLVSMRQRRPVAITACSSTLESMARALLGHDVTAGDQRLPRMASIVGQSEAIAPEARQTLHEILGCEVFGRYGLEELGIVAQQVPGSGQRYRVNQATHHVEVLAEDADRPAPPGQTGRIVVTDLVNAAQPMIRYDTGDLGSFALGPDGRPDPAWLEPIQGRRADQIYDVDDVPLSPLVMYKIWWRYPEVQQYQLVQLGRGDYVLRLKAPPHYSRGNEFARDFQQLAGHGAQVSVELTNEDFVLSSGKRRSMVSRYSPAHAS